MIFQSNSPKDFGTEFSRKIPHFPFPNTIEPSKTHSTIEQHSPKNPPKNNPKPKIQKRNRPQNHQHPNTQQPPTKPRTIDFNDRSRLNTAAIKRKTPPSSSSYQQTSRRRGRAQLRRTLSSYIPKRKKAAKHVQNAHEVRDRLAAAAEPVLGRVVRHASVTMRRFVFLWVFGEFCGRCYFLGFEVDVLKVFVQFLVLFFGSDRRCGVAKIDILSFART